MPLSESTRVSTTDAFAGPLYDNVLFVSKLAEVCGVCVRALDGAVGESLLQARERVGQ